MYADRLRYAATATGCYSGPAIKIIGGMLDKLDADLDRQRALRECRNAYNPEGKLSNWQVALAIQDGIKRLDRIRPGRLLTPLEDALTTLAEGPQSAVKIHGFLTELR